MSFPDLPPDLVDRLERVQRAFGRRLRPRLVHLPDPDLRGRLHEIGATVVLDVNDINPGFFWHLDVLRRLLDHLEPCGDGSNAPPLPWDLRDGEQPCP